MALTVLLLGFNNGRAGRMTPFPHARRVAAPSWCGELPWGPCLSGRRRGLLRNASNRVVRRVLCAHRARFLLLAQTLLTDEDADWRAAKAALAQESN